VCSGRCDGTGSVGTARPQPIRYVEHIPILSLAGTDRYSFTGGGTNANPTYNPSIVCYSCYCR